MAVPTFDEMFNELLRALKNLGGSASVSEINESVGEILQLSEEDLGQIHRGTTTKFRYRLAWTRNYLKRYGLLENSSHGVWALTQKGKETPSVDKEEVKRVVRSLSQEAAVASGDEEKEPMEGINEEEEWKEKLLSAMQNMAPDAFERFCQRLLRESGFVQVEVTGKSGDGGIDGKGIIRLSGLLNFRVVFQCKRYSGSVSPGYIRDFRGAIEGRADRGILITTGTFTRDAKLEAVRDGARPIDLIDGELLVQKVKELGLGVNISMEELVEVNEEWFSNF